ncbi:MAG: extracellular solute-binding protein [Propionibacteriaceae bacterium]|jgi:arabinogalactan oligomer/maltooligosaccharide transport system substrate-binding protein|nr:extracellular solute-binding protein [Propionibacteriaceae bacterium]
MRGKVFTAGAIAALLTLSGCGGGATPTSEPPASEEASVSAEPTTEAPADNTAYEGITLTVWTDETRNAPVTAAAKTFEEATGAKVEIVQKNYDDIRSDFITQVPSGKGPDITIGAHDWLGELIANGVVATVELGDKKAEFEPVSISAFSQDGQVYGVPYAIENIALIRNTDLAAAAPATWDDAQAAAKDAGTKYGVLLQVGETGDPYTMYPLQVSFGAPVFAQNDDGSYKAELALGGDNGTAFAEWLAEQGKAKTLSTSITYDIAVEAFAKGEAPFIIGGPWMIDSFKDLNLAIDPIPSAGGQTASPFTGVQGFYISAQSANPLVATDFLTNYIATEDIQYQLYQAGNRTPALTAAAEKAKSDPITAGFAEVAKTAVPMPSITAMGEVWNYWGVTEANILTGKQKPADGWDKMVSDIQAAIDKAS